MTVQTQQQAEQVILQWESTAPIEKLAQTDWNIQKIIQYVKSHGGIFTVSLLNQAVAALRTELQWIGPVPGEATPKLRGSLAEKLWQMGHGKSAHLSYSEKAELEKESENRLSSARDNVSAIAERHELVKQLYEAEHVVMTRPSGPFAGRTDYAATERERAIQTARVKQLVKGFNSKHPQYKIE